MTEKGRIQYDIMTKYTAGKITQAEANTQLEAAGIDIRIDVGANTLTPAEIAATKVGATPAEANGYGLMSTGTGTTNKVQVVKGKVLGGGVGAMYALLFIGGKMYHVNGETVVD